MAFGCHSLSLVPSGRHWLSFDGHSIVNVGVIYKETINFGYYSRGSLYETGTWLTKAHNRGLITGEVFHKFMIEIDDIGVKLNNISDPSENKRSSRITTE